MKDTSRTRKPAPFEWISRPMHARADISKKEAVRAAADLDLLPRPSNKRGAAKRST